MTTAKNGGSGSESQPIVSLPKSTRKQMIREIIARYQFGDSFSDEDCKTVSDACGYKFRKVSR